MWGKTFDGIDDDDDDDDDDNDDDDDDTVWRTYFTSYRYSETAIKASESLVLHNPHRRIPTSLPSIRRDLCPTLDDLGRYSYQA